MTKTMNKTLKNIGLIADTIAWSIKWFSTLKVISIILFMPLILMIILYAGQLPAKIPEAYYALNVYTCYLLIAISSWIIHYIQKYYVSKIKIRGTKKWNYK